MKTALAIALCLAISGCKGAPTKPNEAAPSEHTSHQGGPAPASPASPSTPTSSSAPAGYAAIALDPSKLGGLSISTTIVQDQHFVRTLRTTGVIAVDETRTSHIHPKVRGVIETIYVDFVGKEVRQGEPLCALYSQEVFAAELEFLSILDRAANVPKRSGEFAQAEQDAQTQLLAAARRRLSLWDVPASEIARLEAAKQARRTFPLLAARKGVVVSKQAVAGAYVDPSIELYTISDLSTVWLLTDVYESDVPFMKVGQTAKIMLQGESSPVEAAVSFLPPTIDEATRTLKVRFDLPNKARRFRPGAFAEVTMDLHLDQGLGIPESAVIRTGTRSIVFVVRELLIEPREVVLGPLVGDHYRVVSGVQAGENVATSAQFLLDSESRLQASTTGGGKANGRHTGHGG
ncbi:MAG TPA: efflux RND transporter periplasmic adaptor subunit [Polyangiaceae bacterium]|nr:efflux RND transporter periplasmic adaptor subunit [Polyangiaceae bacterium]